MYQRHGDWAREARDAIPGRAAWTRVSGQLDRMIPSGWLLAGLGVYLGLDALLLWRFLDFAPAWLYAAAAVPIAAGAALTVRGTAATAPAGPSLRCLLICLATAAVLLALGGEGRLFYANIDWQVRDAVLRDMAVNPWPFAYTGRGVPEVLRAPIGMYLAPALAAKAFGQSGGDYALLIQNSLFLGILLALAATLFEGKRARAIALATFVGFSGMDALGELLAAASTGRPFADHFEFWTRLQYSSHVTQMFWVPQHALAGWLGAVTFLLWRTGRLPLGIFLAGVPLAILWSPLGAIGTLPFAAIAGLSALARRELRAIDLLAPLLTTLLALPTLAYLAAAPGSVGAKPFPIAWNVYVLFELLEVVPFLIGVMLAARGARFGGVALATVAVCLLLLPFAQVGRSVDFMMRASICALAILAAQVADVLIDRRTADPRFARWRTILIGCLAVGSLTGLAEIRRSLRWPASSAPGCSLFGAWDANTIAGGKRPDPAEKSTYVAPVAELARPIRPQRPRLIPTGDPAQCWARPWYRPSGV